MGNRAGGFCALVVWHRPSRPPQSGAVEFDVIVVGTGLSGGLPAAAYLLAADAMAARAVCADYGFGSGS
jgi:hypothetical protein